MHQRELLEEAKNNVSLSSRQGFILKAMKGSKMAHKARISAVVIVWLDLAVNVIHALAHSGANIWLSFFGNAFVGVVILAAPLVSLFLLHAARLEWLGALLLCSPSFKRQVLG
jgi:hypothetical protein